MKVVKETSFEQWRDVLSKIYKDNFEDPKVENADQVKMLDVLSKNEKAAEHEELIKQRDFLSKKLDTMAVINKRVEKDKD